MTPGDLKARFRVPEAWRSLGLPGVPGKNCQSPWPTEHAHGDANPSFSVFDEGRRWKDFATGEGGDVIDFVAKERRRGTADALNWIRSRLGLPTHEGRAAPPKTAPPPPALRRGTKAELVTLAERRGFGPKGLRLAEDRGFLWFGVLWGHSAWCVTDQRRRLVEFRRLDGANWPAFGRLQERKAHCVGAGKCWPIGTLESGPFPKVVMVEGAPDLLAACHFIAAENKVESVAPVAVLGASNHHLDPEALGHFRGKSVCIYPHVDPAGRRAVCEWAKALQVAGAARVAAFDLSGLTLRDGTPGKDLADACRLDADTWERERKFREVMP